MVRGYKRSSWRTLFAGLPPHASGANFLRSKFAEGFEILEIITSGIAVDIGLELFRDLWSRKWLALVSVILKDC